MARARTSSQSALRRGGASGTRARPPGKPTAKAKTSHLFVSFWDLCLENLPLGLFSHRELTAKEAKRLIDRARAAHSLRGVSQDDLLAPYRKREKGNHAKLCRVLTEDYEIALSLEDFVLDDRDEKGKAGYFINPLQFAQIDRAKRLLVVNCHYVLPERSRKARLDFDVAADSVTFCGFDCARPSSTRHSMTPKWPQRPFRVASGRLTWRNDLRAFDPRRR
jgi:hypothetical protein